MSESEQLAALLDVVRRIENQEGDWPHLTNESIAALLFAAGVRVPTEAGDGLRAAAQALLRDPAGIPSDEGFDPGLVAVSRGHLHALRAALAATPAPSLDREPEGIVQRAHVACCWCGEHHEEGR